MKPSAEEVLRRCHLVYVFSLVKEHLSPGRQNKIKIVMILIQQQVFAALLMFAKKKALKALSRSLFSPGCHLDSCLIFKYRVRERL